MRRSEPTAVPVTGSSEIDHGFMSARLLRNTRLRPAARGCDDSSLPDVSCSGAPAGRYVTGATRCRYKKTPLLFEPAAANTSESSTQATPEGSVNMPASRKARVTPVLTGAPPSTGTIHQ